MKILKIFFIFYMVIGFISTNAWACECPPLTAELAKKSYDGADLVVKATLVDPSNGWGNGGGVARVHIDHVYKSEDNTPDVISVDFNSNTAACGHQFTNGETGIYAIYDTRSIGLTSDGNRGYGFRMMVSCDQENVRHYLKNLKEKKETE